MKELWVGYKKWLEIAWWLFALGIAAGIVTYFVYPDLLFDILRMFEDKFGPDRAADWGLAKDIFFQNLSVSMIAMFGGLVLAIAPVTIALVNGFILGFIITSTVALRAEIGLNPFVLFFGGIVPHGVLEIPALLLAVALGLRLGTEWLSKNSAGKRKEVFKLNFERNVVAIPLVVLALILAAIIEVFISGKLVGN